MATSKGSTSKSKSGTTSSKGGSYKVGSQTFGSAKAAQNAAARIAASKAVTKPGVTKGAAAYQSAYKKAGGGPSLTGYKLGGKAILNEKGQPVNVKGEILTPGWAGITALKTGQTKFGVPITESNTRYTTEQMAGMEFAQPVPEEPIPEEPIVPADITQTETTTTEAQGGADQEKGLPKGAGGKVGATTTVVKKQQAELQPDAQGGYSAFNQLQLQNIATMQADLQKQGLSEVDIQTKLAGTFAGGSNDIFNQRYAASKVGDAIAQQGANNVKPPTPVPTRESDDSPYRNKYGNDAITQEKLHPGYMNDRNTIKANKVVLDNPNIKYMTSAERIEAITNQIIDDQEQGIDPAIRDWYDNTAKNINSIISRQLPELHADDYFNMLLRGDDTTQIANNNPFYQTGKRRYDELNKYSSMNEDSLIASVTNGSVLAGSQLWNDLVAKGLGGVLQKAQAIQSTGIEQNVFDYLFDSFNYDTTKSLASQGATPLSFNNLEDALSMKIISTMIGDQLPTFSSFLLQDENVQNARKASNEIASKINVLNQQVSDLSDSMKEMFLKGGGESGNDAFLQAYVSEKAKPMIRQLDMMQTQYTNAMAVLSDATENAKADFEVKEYNKTMKLQVYQMLLDMMQTKSANATAASQQEFENQMKMLTPVKTGKNAYSNFKFDANGNLILSSIGGDGTGVGGISGINSVADYIKYTTENKIITMTSTRVNIDDTTQATNLAKGLYNKMPEADKESTYQDLLKIGVDVKKGTAKKTTASRWKRLWGG